MDQAIVRIKTSLILLASILFPLFSHADFVFSEKLVSAAKERTKHFVLYDGSYQSIDYPGGDVSPNRGVCTDVIIRTYRQLGIDLQKEVHEDIREHFSLYPSKRIWGLNRPDKNIDHRRVPNLQTFFARKGQSLAISDKASDYQPGDIVTWMLDGNLPHIGIVVDEKSRDKQRYMVVHNIGFGPKLEDMLFDFTITGHYRYTPALHSTTQLSSEPNTDDSM